MKWLKKQAYIGTLQTSFGYLYSHSFIWYNMAHKLSIFRGLVTFKSNIQKIWGVLVFLSIVTAIEVALGIIKPSVLLVPVLGMKGLNWIFIILTLVKAYYIAWDFMHLRDERRSLSTAFDFHF